MAPKKLTLYYNYLLLLLELFFIFLGTKPQAWKLD